VSNQNSEIRYRLTRSNTVTGRRSANSTASSYSLPLGRQLPRITRLMALAIKLDGMRRDRDAPQIYVELAQLGRVSRARLSQIMNLLYLAPDIQEQLLFLPPLEKGREPLNESALRTLSRYYDWAEQRQALLRIQADRTKVL